MFKTLSSLFILLCFSSCAFILDQLGEQPQNYDLLPLVSPTHCPLLPNAQDSLVSSNKSAPEVFSRFLQRSEVKKENLSFMERAVLWSLLQMHLRPEASSPTARPQILLTLPSEKGPQAFYWDFKAPILASADLNAQPYYPYLEALHFLLAHDHARHSLTSLARLLDRYLVGELKTDEDFVAFLAKNKKELAEVPLLFSTYFRGDEPLRLGEALPTPRFEEMLAKFALPKKSQSERNSHLFTHTPKNPITFETQCNYDMGLYENSLFLVNKNAFSSNVFGIKGPKGESFFAVSAQYFEHPKNIKNTVFIQGQSNVRTAALCFLTWPKSETHNMSVAAMISTDERDPGQHLFHLIHDPKMSIPSLENIDQAIHGPRHLFLSNPVRLIVESRRTGRHQLAELMGLQVPIYHSLGLGKVWANLSVQGQVPQSGFILDDRKYGFLTCK